MTEGYETAERAEQMELILKKLEDYKDQYGIDELFRYKVKQVIKK